MSKAAATVKQDPECLHAKASGEDNGHDVPGDNGHKSSGDGGHNTPGRGGNTGALADPTAADRDTILKLIEMTWADVHHSRNQNWQFWVGLAGVGAALGGVGNDKTPPALIPCVLGLGVIIALVAAIVSWCHWELHCKKMAYVEQLERLLAGALPPSAARLMPYSAIYRKHRLGNRDPEHLRADLKDWLVVSGVIFALYVSVTLSLAAALVAMTHPTWLVDGSETLTSQAAAHIVEVIAPIAVVAFAVAYFVSNAFMQTKKRNYHRRCHALSYSNCGGEVELREDGLREDKAAGGSR